MYQIYQCSEKVWGGHGEMTSFLSPCPLFIKFLGTPEVPSATWIDSSGRSLLIAELQPSYTSLGVSGFFFHDRIPPACILVEDRSDL